MAKDRTYRIRGVTAATGLPATTAVALTRPRRLLPGTSRGGAAAAVTLGAAELVRVTLGDDLVLWTRVDDLIRERGRREATRGGGGADLWDLDTGPPARARGGTRGALGLGIALLEVFGLDLKGQTARGLATRLEDRQLQGGAPGLYRCAPLDAACHLVPIGPPISGEAPLSADAGPILLFIHGTGSSCAGSFGALWGPQSPLGAAARADLTRRYGDRILAWEHRSLTESPIANALALARALPAGADLHLVTHSRGGLVGELLCLGARDPATDPLKPAFLGRLFAADATLAEQLGLGLLTGTAHADHARGYAADLAALTQLLALLDAAPFTISRYVRTACPASGTTLASGRLDRWLSVLGHLGGLGGLGLVGDALDFVLAVVQERTDPRSLPGLEAMLPGSALTRLLRHPDLVTGADLSVIAGDTAGDSTWGRLKLLVADWFFASDHDLVVNTGSMVGGLRRPAGGGRYLIDQGPEVNHFNYFKNERSLRWLAAALGRRDGADAGFMPIERAPRTAPIARGATRAAPGGRPRPLAVIIPGILGSTLAADGRTIWPHPGELARGGLHLLRLDGPAQVQATGLLPGRYAPLSDFLGRSHRVEVFPYDWRQSVRDSAAMLTERLDAWLPEAERAGLPVHLIAHGSGGLVVQAMSTDGGAGTALWRRIAALPESRLLLLGTPSQGAYETLRWLTGRHPSLVRLGLLDVTQTLAALVGILAAYPGLLELLPNAAADPDFSDPAPWQELASALGAGWTAPAAAALRAARATWTQLRAAPPDPRLLRYVAGDQPATIAGYRLDPPAEPGGIARLRWQATRQGDGVVPWRTGVPPQTPVWYLAGTAHEALCASAQAFPAYLDLLTTGKTARLPQAPPGASRGGTGADGGVDAGADALFPLPEQPPADAIPDESQAAALGFGAGLSADAEEASTVPVIRVTIRHGDLGYARHPVLVGHYQGDTIVSAERALDQRLAGALSERLQLGLYPGRPGTHALFFNERAREQPAGALVVGLGQVGELAPTLLETVVRDALLDYALRVARWPDERFGAAATVKSAAVSCLLVGSGAGGLTVADSVKTILRAALAAADRLAESGLGARVAIDRIEFLEIYHDLAIAAARALEETLQDTRLAARLEWPRRVLEAGEGGQRRVRCEEAPEWWQRLEIIQESTDQTGGTALRFIASTDRARAEVTLAAGQLRLADSFIARASRSDAANTESAKTLFEMLLPNRLRQLAPRQGDLVLLVDETSARFPWELLEDRWSHSGRPPAVGAGMVRQLKTAQYRANPGHTTEPRAYVVGNPNLADWDAFGDLPGARDEANLVVRLLREHDYQVRDCIDEEADTILNGLHKDAWRILHLAGHGDHEFPLPAAAPGTACPACGQAPAPREARLSGMVIGRETFLTPGDVEQLRWVPELVFINCCHLGKTQRSTPPRYNELAANLAVQFVRMGVKAVIAAGWAVNDQAGLTFAECFYTRMLAGEFFGEAVRAAREEVWERFPDLNTWGAYQCYGDPAYRLRIQPTQNAPAARRPYHDHGELIADLDNLSQQIRMQVHAGDDDPQAVAALHAQIEALVAAIPATEVETWCARADVAAALGQAWGETRAYAQAVHWLEQALRAETGDCSLRILSQCHDLRVRLVGEEWRALRNAPADEGREARRAALVERVRASIEELTLVCRRAATVERLSTLAHASRYLAWLQSEPGARREALVAMAGYLEQALAKATEGDPRYFPLWAAAQVLTRDPSRVEDWQSRLPDDLRAMIEAATADQAAAPSFSKAVAVADNETVLLLTQDAPAPGATGRIIALYQAALRGGASPREIATVQDDLDFLIALSEGLPAPVRRALEEIRAAI